MVCETCRETVLEEASAFGLTSWEADAMCRNMGANIPDHECERNEELHCECSCRL